MSLGAHIAAADGCGETPDRTHVAVFQVDPDATLQAARQHHGPVADADQAADRQLDRVEQLAHFAVAPFGDDDAVPVIRSFAAAVFDGLETGRLAVDVHAFEQLRLRTFVEPTQHANRVLAFHAEARVHQLVGQFAGVGEQQQALGVQVEPTDRLPLALLQSRQPAEHRRPVLGVVVGDDFSGRLVVGNDARRRGHDAHAHRLAVDLDLVAEGNALAGVRRLSVDRHQAVGDPLLHVAPRTHAGLCQHLVQLRRIGLGSQHALGRAGWRFGDGLLDFIELAGQDLGEHLAGLLRRHGGRVVDHRIRLVVVIVEIAAAGCHVCACSRTLRTGAVLASAPAVAPAASAATFGAGAVAHRRLWRGRPFACRRCRRFGGCVSSGRRNFAGGCLRGGGERHFHRRRTIRRVLGYCRCNTPLASRPGSVGRLGRVARVARQCRQGLLSDRCLRVIGDSDFHCPFAAHRLGFSVRAGVDRPWGLLGQI